MNTTVSIIIPVFNEEAFLSNCIKSVLEQDYPKELIEILIVDGNSTDNSAKIIANYASTYDNIKYLLNYDRVTPISLNKAISESMGDLIIRLDSHSIYPKDYISKLVYYSTKLNAANVGGIVKTTPSKSGLVPLSISIALTHFFGVGNSLYRIKSRKKLPEYIEVDTVPFGCFKREVFSKYGKFDIELIRNQDNEFNERIKKGGEKIYLIPSVEIIYFSRENYKKLFNMFFGYGKFGPLVDKKIGKRKNLRRYIPAIFVLYSVLLVILKICGIDFKILYMGILIYIILGFVFSLSLSIRSKNLMLFPLIWYSFGISHFSYGLGYLWGLIYFNIQGNKKNEL